MRRGVEIHMKKCIDIVRNSLKCFGEWCRGHEKVVIAILVIICISSVLKSNYPKHKQPQIDNTSVEVFAPISSEEYEDKTYQEVEKIFKKAGFKVVYTDTIDLLNSMDLDKLNFVYTVSIGGDYQFDKGEQFYSNDLVEIVYYKRSEVFSPFSSTDIFNMNYQEAVKAFEDAGFLNIEIEKIEDLILGIFNSDGEVSEITIDGKEDFDKGEVFNSDSKVIIAYHTYSSEKETSTTKEEIIEETTISKDEVKLDKSAYLYRGEFYEDVAKELKEKGFTNIEIRKVYDLDTGYFDSLSIGTVKDISINGENYFDKGDIFKKKSKVIITYHLLEIEDPNINYNVCSVSKLINDLENNALKAKELYMEQYVEITGRISEIDASGEYICLEPSDDKWSFTSVQCNIQTEKQKQQIMDMSKGQVITLKGQIVLVGEVLGYTLDIYDIKK